MIPLSPRVALVGCGGIARAHAQAMGAAPIVALCDQSEGAARRLREEFALDAPVFPSLEAALGDVIDVVVICTPPTTHFALVRLALEAGAHVLCEKPLATRADESQVLVELARARNLTLRTSAKYRFCEGIIAAQSLLQGGEAGTLQKLRLCFGAPFDFKGSWHSDPHLSGGGVWMDNGPHALDLARFFAGDLRLERIEEWTTRDELETQVQIALRSMSGAAVQIELSWLTRLSEQLAVLKCTGGEITVGWQQTGWYPRDATPRVLAGAYDKAACFSAQWNGFLMNDARFAAEDGARVVELLGAIYEGAKNLDSRATSPLCSQNSK